MEKDAVLKIRENFYNATFTLNSRKDGTPKTFKPSLHICCDNSLNVLDNHEGSVIWDDDNEIFYWFRSNTPSGIPNSPSAGMSMGDKVEWAMECIGVNFEQIQNMRILMNQEAYDNLCASINSEKTLITDEQKLNNEIALIEETDMYAVITRKQEINYNTGLPKKYDKNYKDEDSSYVFAVHPEAGGGV